MSLNGNLMAHDAVEARKKTQKCGMHGMSSNGKGCGLGC